LTIEGDVTIEKVTGLDDVAIRKGAGLDDVGSSLKSGSHDEKEFEVLFIFNKIFQFKLLSIFFIIFIKIITFDLSMICIICF